MLRLSVNEIRWAHDNIRTPFRNGMLLVDTLWGLHIGKMSHTELPTFEVMQLERHWFAITGNRRWWVFRKYAGFLNNELAIAVRKIDSNQAHTKWVKQRLRGSDIGLGPPRSCSHVSMSCPQMAILDNCSPYQPQCSIADDNKKDACNIVTNQNQTQDKYQWVVAQRPLSSLTLPGLH